MEESRLAWMLLGALLGAVAGSFLATLAIRWPQARSIADGRSRCDGCGVVLGPAQLMPLLSYAMARGRCRRCAAPIDWRHPAMEIACVAIGAAAFMAKPGLEGAAGALFGWLLATLALLDLDHFWLPDALVAPLAGLGLASGALGLAPPLSDRVIGLAAGWGALALLAAIYRAVRKRHGLGAGDAKLLGAIGAWLGWTVLPWVVLGACGLGLAWVLAARARGTNMAATDRLPLGSLLAIAASVAWFF